MKTNHKLTLAVLAGVAMGIIGGTAIHARPANPAPGYVIAEVDVKDPDTFQKYSAQVPGTLTPFGGHFLVRGGKIEGVEANPPKRYVIIAFDSMEKASAWESSPGYEAIKPIRHSSAASRVFIVEGLPTP